MILRQRPKGKSLVQDFPEDEVLSFGSADCHFGNVTSYCKAIQCVCWRPDLEESSKSKYFICKKKLTNLTSFDRDTLIGSAELVHPVHANYEEKFHFFAKPFTSHFQYLFLIDRHAVF